MKRKHVALAVVLSVLVLSAGQPVSALSEEVLITFPRSVVGISQHGNLLVVVHFRKDDKNRAIDLVWESDEEYGRSVAEIDSRNDGVPIAKDLVLSAGEYVFVATLHRCDGSKTITTKTRFVTR